MAIVPRRVQSGHTRFGRSRAGAIVVDRPSSWANPFIVVTSGDPPAPQAVVTERRAQCVSMFRTWLQDPDSVWAEGAGRARWIVEHVRELRGHDLACRCPLGEPCHADVLLEMANPSPYRGIAGS